MNRYTRTLTATGFMASFALVSLTISSPIQEENDPPERPGHRLFMSDSSWDAMHAEESKIQNRRERIKAELAAIERDGIANGGWAGEWAGWYYTGDGLGTNISIHLAPESGISILNYGCMGLYSADHGDVVEVFDDGLLLELKFGDAEHSFLSERVYFVRWGEARFLVPEWQMMEIVNWYNDGRENSYLAHSLPRFFSDEEDFRTSRHSLHQPAGIPDLPAKYEDMLLEHSVELKVSHVGHYTTSTDNNDQVRQTCVVTFDRGNDTGMHVGMEFKYRSQRPGVRGEFWIAFADDGVSTAVFDVRSSDGVIANLPALGDIVSAGPSAR